MLTCYVDGPEDGELESGVEGNLTKFSSKGGKKNSLKVEDKAEKKKQREVVPQQNKLKKNVEDKRHFSNAHNRKKFLDSTNKKVEKTIFKRDKGFYKERGLKDQVEIGHESKKPYHCPKCDRFFSQAFTLNCHMKVAHRPDVHD